MLFDNGSFELVSIDTKTKKPFANNNGKYVVVNVAINKNGGDTTIGAVMKAYNDEAEKIGLKANRSFEKKNK